MRNIRKSQVTDHRKSEILSWQEKWTYRILGCTECDNRHCQRNFGFGRNNSDFGRGRSESRKWASSAEIKVGVASQILSRWYQASKEVRETDKKGAVAKNKPDWKLVISGGLVTAKKDTGEVVKDFARCRVDRGSKAEGNFHWRVLQKVWRIDRNRVQNDCLSSAEVFEGTYVCKEG